MAMEMPAEHSTLTHTLVVGGTGMLRKATLYFATLGHDVSVVARTVSSLERLEREAEGMAGRIHPIALDYREQAALAAGLDEAIRLRGPIGLAVCWIHSVGREAFPTIVRKMSVSPRSWRLFHVRGSGGSDASWLNPSPVRETVVAPGLYREVMLGFVPLGTGSRWLTNEEISDGVIEAVDTDAERSIVGVVEPWELRP